MKMNRWMEVLLAAGLVGAAATASAQVKIGVTLSATGPAASLGIPEKNTIALLPKEIAGKSVQYIVLDDASDTSRAVQNARKLIDEDHVDAIIGSSVTPNSLAMLDPVSQGKTPTISLAASAQIISPMDAKRAWMFKVPQNDQLMADAIAGYMAKHGVKTVGFIGFADAYGDSWYKTFSAAAEKNGLKLVSNERFNRTDASVMGQVLKLLGSNPDAVLIAGSGTPAALPAKTLKERGYKGKVYQTHGVANNDFLRVCGKDCEGEILPAGPVLVTDQLPDSNPVKKPALGYKAAYEKAYGAGSLATFGGHAWDAGLLLQRAIPDALKKGQPGTEAFREALRASLESVKDLPVSHGVINTTATDHNGFDTRARVMVQIVDGKWKLQAE
ncbi:MULTISPECIES: ABC transporter substrate-binding protein [unclassified Burkholderia]|uniref:ABC transporter substrate-binding protein n=1 Tax=unclassified Burkholderia TaxID=2613784 RepID=UPI000F55CEB3|nr:MULTISPECIES: ABC transporter substrate-binding protein [unclassified Burkholderia]RQR77429.1 branched-chain amino acid ABC transporter substrate-binding protein [Burkholderia sp. Bp9011]RQR92709.1 branched-chain amino acid ABC transporter substrate-binding protein [Burkholderia sp. Bp9010]RQS01550.1 branched-chain amino acid ABC transporter substrate-binding protein [Burkholderia sp. Bp8991]RQS70368.1 branched-chain amino acid ABC transporter substrate-binding protein [Burkholderia sp. Bp89